jgi:hypothetical protein
MLLLSTDAVRIGKKSGCAVRVNFSQINYFAILVVAFQASMTAEAFSALPSSIAIQLRPALRLQYRMPGAFRATKHRVSMAIDRGDFRDQYSEFLPGEAVPSTGKDDHPPLLVLEFEGDEPEAGELPKGLEVVLFEMALLR